MLWVVSTLKRLCFFLKIDFSIFLINRTCFLTGRKCNKNFGYNLPGSIGAWLVLDQSKILFDRSNLIFNWSKISQLVFKKVFLSRVLHTFQIFSKALSLFYVNRSNLSLFCRFLPKFSQVFLSLNAGKTFFSIKITFFMHFP